MNIEVITFLCIMYCHANDRLLWLLIITSYLDYIKPNYGLNSLSFNILKSRPGFEPGSLGCHSTRTIRFQKCVPILFLCFCFFVFFFLSIKVARTESLMILINTVVNKSPASTKRFFFFVRRRRFDDVSTTFRRRFDDV